MNRSRKWRWFDVCVIAAAAACGAGLAARPVHNYDVWHHMKMGQYIVEHGRVPLADMFSYNARHPWVNPAWLADVVLYAVQSLGGWAGLVGLKVAMAAATLIVLALSCRLLRLSVVWTCVLVLLAALAAHGRFLCRPLIFAFPLLALVQHLLWCYRLGDARRAVWWTPALTLLWANLHASFPLAWVLVGLTWLAAARAAGKGWRADGKVRTLFAVGVACVLVCFVSPFGWRNLWHAVTLSFERGLVQHPAEWGAMPFSVAYFNPSSEHFLQAYAWFWILAAVAWVAALVTARRLAFVDALTLLFFTALALSAQRHAAMFAIGIVPVVAKQAGRLRLSRGRICGTVVGVVASCLALNALLSTWQALSRGRGTGSSCVDWARYPVGAVDFVVEHGIDGRMFNRWGWGSYIIWRCWPERKVFADGRLEVFDPEIYEDHNCVVNGEPGWERVLDKYDVDYMIVPHNRRAPMAYQHPIWRLVHWDDIALVYVRDVPKFRRVIEKFECGASNPMFFEQRRHDPALAAKMLSQLERLTACKVPSIAALRNLGKLRLQRGETHRAVAAFERAVARAPQSAANRHDLGLAFMLDGQLDRAKASLHRALQLARDDATRGIVAFRLSQCCERLGDAAKAKEWLERSRRWHPAHIDGRAD